jgi:hypothetical protein
MKTFRKWKKHKNKTRKKKQKNKILKGGVKLKRNNGSQSARSGNRSARQGSARAQSDPAITAGWIFAIENADDMGCNDDAIQSFKTEYEEFKEELKFKVNPKKEWKKIIGDFVKQSDSLLHLSNLSLRKFEKKLKEQTLHNPDSSKSPTTSPRSPRSPVSPLYSETFRPW